MVRDVFPQIGEIVGPELAAYYGDVDADAWYDGEPFLATVRYLREFVSPHVMVLLGNQFMEIFRSYLAARGVTSTHALADQTPDIFRSLVRGDGAGEWLVDEFAPGRAVVRETGVSAGTDFATGILKGALGAVGAYNVRVTVLDDRAADGGCNCYLAEWLEPEAPPGQAAAAAGK